MALSFSEKLKADSKRSLEKLDKRLYSITFKLFTTIIYGTPVDKGDLISAWYPLAGVDFSSEIEYLKTTSGSPSLTRVNELRNSNEFLYKDGSFTMSNNLPYAYKIEKDGWSGKAPNGMVEVSVRKIQGLIQAGHL